MIDHALGLLRDQLTEVVKAAEQRTAEMRKQLSDLGTERAVLDAKMTELRRQIDIEDGEEAKRARKMLAQLDQLGRDPPVPTPMPDYAGGQVPNRPMPQRPPMPQNWPEQYPGPRAVPPNIPNLPEDHPANVRRREMMARRMQGGPVNVDINDPAEILPPQRPPRSRGH